jgi:Fe-S cluster assembly protein SufD
MVQIDSQESQYLSTFAAFEQSSASASPGWLKALRKNAITNFESDGFPTARRGNELWKYTDIRPLASHLFLRPKGNGHEEIDFTPYDLPCPRIHQLVFVDGHYSADRSTQVSSQEDQQAGTIGHRSEGLIVGRLSEAIQQGLPLVEQHLSQQPSAGAFAALNTAFLEDGAFVYIPDGVSVYEPIHLLFITTGRAQVVTHPRVLVIAGAGSKATVIQSYESLSTNAEPYFTNAVTEIVMGPGAVLHHYKLQREASTAYHIAATYAALAQGSLLSSVVFDLGGGLVRNDTSATLGGNGASVKLDGLYLGDGQRHIDNHTFVDHAVPSTFSDEVYKGILKDAAHGVFVGHVLVRHDAQHTVAHQVNKNILLSDAAEIDSQPKLEIFADDVQCTHGAAVGRLDPNAIFYLNSRGLNAQEAQDLLMHGFVSEVLAAVVDDAVRQYIDHAVLTKFS